ncbi:MAG: polysaccharide biosynthesis C-terminal domain-containing protein [Huintestinicola sp.]
MIFDANCAGFSVKLRGDVNMRENDTRSGFLYGSAVLILSAVITKAVGALFKIPLTNMLGGAGMGYFSAAYGIFMPVYAVSATGLPAAAARSVAGCISLGRADMIHTVKTTALRMFGAAGLIGTLLILLGAYPLCVFTSGSIAALPAVIAIAPTVAAGCLVSVYRGCFEGRRNMVPTAISQVIEAVVKLVAGLAACSWVMNTAREHPGRFIHIIGAENSSADIMELALPYAAAAAVLGITLASFAGLIYIAILDKRSSAGEPVYHADENERRRVRADLLKTAVPAAVGALVTNLTSVIDLATIMRTLSMLTEKSPEIFDGLRDSVKNVSDIPNFVFGSFTGIAVTIFNLVPSVTNMFGKGMLPVASAAYAEKDRRKLGECSYNVLLSAALLSMPAGAGIAAMSPRIMELLFSGREAEIAVCVMPLRILGAALPFLCISSAAFSIFQAVGRADIPVKLMGIGAAVKLAGNLVLTSVPRLNISGAALSTLICYIVIFVLSIHCLKICGGLDGKRAARAFFTLIPSSLLCGASALFVYYADVMGAETGIKTLVSCVSGAIIYIIVTYFSGVITKSTLKSLIS